MGNSSRHHLEQWPCFATIFSLPISYIRSRSKFYVHLYCILWRYSQKSNFQLMRFGEYHPRCQLQILWQGREKYTRRLRWDTMHFSIITIPTLGLVNHNSSMDNIYTTGLKRNQISALYLNPNALLQVCWFIKFLLLPKCTDQGGIPSPGQVDCGQGHWSGQPR